MYVFVIVKVQYDYDYDDDDDNDDNNDDIKRSSVCKSNVNVLFDLLQCKNIVIPQNIIAYLLSYYLSLCHCLKVVILKYFKTKQIPFEEC